MADKGDIGPVKGISVAGSLPRHIADRQAESARNALKGHGIDDASVESVTVNTASPGTCITLWAEYEDTVLGSDSIGEIGKPAEKVGKECADGLIKSIESGAVLDGWMSDQMLVFLALADGISKVKIQEFTDHVRSNIMIIESMLKARFEVKERENTVSVNGIGYCKA